MEDWFVNIGLTAYASIAVRPPPKKIENDMILGEDGI